MSSKTVPLKSIARIKGGKRLPKASTLQVEANSHPYLRIVDMGSKYISKDNLQYVPDNVFPSISRYITNTNDVLISIVGTIGLVALVDDELDNASLTENCAKITLTDENYVPEYLYYYLSSDAGQSEIQSRQVGSTQPKLPLYSIEQIPVPSLRHESQITIAKCLGDLDRKIELNRRMNETLEQIGQALFKKYFIDNPEKQGWKKAKIPDLCEVYGGGTPSTNIEEYWVDGDVPWATPTDMTALDSLFINKTSRFVTRLGVENSSTKILPTKSILMTSRATVGNLAVSSVPISTNQGFISMVCKDDSELWYLFWWLKSNISVVQGLASGSTFPEISRGVFKNIDILKPSKEKLVEFEKSVSSVMALIQKISFENETLSITRDVLLPQLMSGKIRV